ncbi:MAG: glycosyltransferase [SAR202 cluster bacterium]|nr:glycosyltransferase [SAR202 cluster bacterium]
MRFVKNKKLELGEPIDASPLVTLVTPAFNSRTYIEETIVSVACQTYPNIEYIVVDGGSTDGTIEIIERYSDDVALLVSEPDNGQADALRKGFRLSSGKVLAWVNADDVYPDYAVEVAVDALAKNDADVVYGNRGLIDQSGNRIGERRLTPFLPYFSREGMRYGGFGVYQPASFWTRETYFESREVDPTFQFAMDTDLFVRFAGRGAKFTFLPRELVHFRIHKASKTSTRKDEAQAEWLRISSSVQPRSLLYRWIIKMVCRVWKLVYHLRDSGGRYMWYLLRDKKYRFVP